MAGDAFRFSHPHDLVDAVTARRASIRSIRDVDARRGTDYFRLLQGCGWPHYVTRFGLEGVLGDTSPMVSSGCCGRRGGTR